MGVTYIPPRESTGLQNLATIMQIISAGSNMYDASHQRRLREAQLAHDFYSKTGDDSYMARTYEKLGILPPGKQDQEEVALPAPQQGVAPISPEATRSRALFENMPTTVFNRLLGLSDRNSPGLDQRIEKYQDARSNALDEARQMDEQGQPLTGAQRSSFLDRRIGRPVRTGDNLIDSYMSNATTAIRRADQGDFSTSLNEAASKDAGTRWSGRQRLGVQESIQGLESPVREKPVEDDVWVTRGRTSSETGRNFLKKAMELRRRGYSTEQIEGVLGPQLTVYNAPLLPGYEIDEKNVFWWLRAGKDRGGGAAGSNKIWKVQYPSGGVQSLRDWQLTPAVLAKINRDGGEILGLGSGTNEQIYGQAVKNLGEEQLLDDDVRAGLRRPAAMFSGMKPGDVYTSGGKKYKFLGYDSSGKGKAEELK